MSHAWGPDGHHTVGALADQLIAGTHAEAQVKTILGSLSLANAAVWADCAKGVNPKTFVYSGEGRFPECKVFETTAGEAEMSDFVQRNSSCVVKPGEEACNKQYHYTDVNIAQGKYKLGLVGTRDDDIVAAISAAAHFLKGDPVPAPFGFKDKHEALLVLSHYVGFALVGCLGLLLQNRRSMKTLLPASIAGSFIFYIVTNSVSWLFDPGYVKNFAVLIQALTIGLPQFSATPSWMFFRNSIVSDLLFTLLFVICMNLGRSMERSRGRAVPRLRDPVAAG